MGCGNTNAIEEKKNDYNINTKRSYNENNNDNNKEIELNIYNNNRNSRNNTKLFSNKEQKEKQDQDIYYKHELTKADKERDIYIKNELNKTDNKEKEKKDKDIYLKKELTEEEKKEKEKIKKTISKKLKSYSFLTISENVLDYLPNDISKNEIRQLIYDALKSSIINDKDKYIKGKNLTVEQVNCLIDILYNCIANIDNDKEEKRYKELLGDVKLKLDFCEINKENVRKIIFKDLDPTDEDIDEILAQFNNSEDRPKLFVIELY